MNKVQELLVPQTIKATYKPAYNLTGSYSIKKANENDYQEWLVYLAYNKISKGDYIVEAYRELDKISWCNVMDNLSPDVYEWVKNNIDGGCLEPFLQKHSHDYDNLRDFLNGFTLATLYLNQKQFPEEDWKWIRISISIILVKALIDTKQ